MISAFPYTSCFKVGSSGAANTCSLGSSSGDLNAKPCLGLKCIDDTIDDRCSQASWGAQTL